MKIFIVLPVDNKWLSHFQRNLFINIKWDKVRERRNWINMLYEWNGHTKQVNSEQELLFASSHSQHSVDCENWMYRKNKERKSEWETRKIVYTHSSCVLFYYIFEFSCLLLLLIREVYRSCWVRKIVNGFLNWSLLSSRALTKWLSFLYNF